MKLLSLFVLCALVFGAIAQNNDNIYLSNESGFSFKSTGNQRVPKYEFWYKNGTHYHVRLQSLFEVDASMKKLPATQVSLPGMGWIVSPISSTDNETLSFNVSGTDPKGVFGQLQFRFHLNANASSGESKIKFDVIMKGYNWQSNVQDSKMVLGWSFSDSDSDNSPDCSTDGTSVKYQNAYFSTASTATTSSGEINVSLVCMNGGAGGLWLVYDHFQADFEHDPELGVNAGSNVGLIVGVVIGVIAFVAIVGFVIFFIVRRRPGYAKH